MKLIILLLLLSLTACTSGGGSDDAVTQLLNNDECTGHGGISYKLTSHCEEGLTLCNDMTCQ